MVVYVLVEGQTEELFVKNCLAPHLASNGIYLIPIIVSTKRVLTGMKTVGGLSNGNLVRFLNEINRLLNSLPPDGLVTTLIDFYAIPSNFPGYDHISPEMDSFQCINTLEQGLHDHFGNSHKFIPYIQMHEFEAFLFSHPMGFESYVDPSLGNVKALVDIVHAYENPELINSNKETAPSKRILLHYPKYKKPLLGNMMILEIGIEHIIAKCPRFKLWIESIIARKS